jgi:hypothetical protein
VVQYNLVYGNAHVFQHVKRSQDYITEFMLKNVIFTLYQYCFAYYKLTNLVQYNLVFCNAHVFQHVKRSQDYITEFMLKNVIFYLALILFSLI